jgi:hypothetical protein
MEQLINIHLEHLQVHCRYCLFIAVCCNPGLPDHVEFGPNWHVKQKNSVDVLGIWVDRASSSSRTTIP